MEKTFRTAFLGELMACYFAVDVKSPSLFAGINPKNNHESWGWMKEIALRTYDLNVDQIMEIVEKVGPEGERDGYSYTTIVLK